MAFTRTSTLRITAEETSEPSSFDRFPTKLGLKESRPYELVLVSAIVFLSPMNYLRMDLLYFTLSDVVAALTFFVLLAANRLTVFPFGNATTSWYLGLTLLLLGLTVGTIVNGDQTDGATVIIQYIFSFVVLPMIIMNRPREEIKLLIKVFVFSIAIVMLHGAYVITFDPSDLRFVSGNGRMYGLIERENAAGATGAVALVLCQWLFMARQISAPVFMLLLVPIAYGVLLTGSNTGFFLAGFGLVALSLSSGSFRTLLVAIVVGAVVVAVVSLWGEHFLPEIFVKRVFGAIISGDSSQVGTFDDRIVLNLEGLQIARNTLWIGLGADQYRTLSLTGNPVHNTYLLLLCEGGIISLVGLTYMLITAFFIGWMAYKRNDRLSGSLTITFVCLFALSLNGFAHVYARFWAIPLLLAIAVSVKNPRASNQ